MTVGVDVTTRKIMVGDTLICLEFWDTAGQEIYQSVSRSYFRRADAVAIVYGRQF